MNKKRIAAIAGIAVAVCVVVGAGIFFWVRQKGASGKAEVYVSTVKSLTEAASGSENRYAGVVEPQKTVKIKLESKQKVKEVKVSEGQSVKAGDVLFEYDLSSNQDNLAQAQLDLERLQNEALSLKEQMDTYEKEKAAAQEEESQLSYTIQIETAKMDLKKNEYSQKSKEAEIKKLQEASTQTQVTSDIDGIIKSIDTSQIGDDSEEASEVTDGSVDTTDGSSSSSAFITILSTGSYRIKGTVNEQNVQNIVEGDPVIIRSRVDEEQTWEGTMGTVDIKNPVKNDSSVMADTMMSGDTGDGSQTSSSSYPFYVEMKSSTGLMLGQHVYIEMDYGQEQAKDGLWLDAYYIVDPDGSPYVWAADKNDRLEKRGVTLGEYDEKLGKYQIEKGLSKEDCIAFPTDDLKEGMLTAINDDAQVPSGGQDDSTGQSGYDEPQILDEGVDGSDTPEGTVTEEDMGGEEVIEDSSGTEEIIEDGTDSMDEIQEDTGVDDGSSGGELQEGAILEEVGPPTEGE